jgi:hypothetical protein
VVPEDKAEKELLDRVKEVEVLLLTPSPHSLLFLTPHSSLLTPHR